ncbi:uncharacterized protein LOC142590911 [Dermacentor variabilis]|uniref:uncharacterized protein LOC142590911 n=1 Tax=Dermacentor variabilis TaxID=34621 RepID=UPI003F5B6CC9
MHYEIPTPLERLGPDDIELIVPGIDPTIPCSARHGGDPSCCHLLGKLLAWNQVLWHIGLQLRELTAPGELSLVRVGHSGSHQHNMRGRDARLVFQVLLVRHRCVVSVDLDEAVLEGGGLGEYRERIVRALWQNDSLKTVTFGSLFADYRCIRDELFGTVAAMTHLQELVISASAVVPPVLLDAICSLLTATSSLTTLSIRGLVFGAEGAMRLLDALWFNDTIAELSVHESILHSHPPEEEPRFNSHLAATTLLRSLTIEGVRSNPQKLTPMLAPLVVRGAFRKLKLVGFLLDNDSACVITRLVSCEGGLLKELDVSGCRWAADAVPRRLDDAGRLESEQPGPAFSKPACPLLQELDDTARVELSFLALSFAELKPYDLRTLFSTACTVESLVTISVSDVAQGELPELCRVIRDTGMSGRVRIEGEYLVDCAVLGALEEFPEALRHAAVSLHEQPSREAFRLTVRLLGSWYQVTTLRLLLTQEVVRDVIGIRLLSNYLSAASELRNLSLTGCSQPDLSRCLRAVNSSHAVLLDAILGNAGIRVLEVDGLRLGDDNLCFLAEEVTFSETLCEFSFSSWDSYENKVFVMMLAEDFRVNKGILRLRVSNSMGGETDEEWFAIEQALGRNMGYAICAAHFVLFDVVSTRCAEAFANVYSCSSLNERVQELASVDEAEATSMIESSLEL